ncbi:MAG: DUF5916 domain-containing protein [Bacteroidales bacterium]
MKRCTTLALFFAIFISRFGYSANENTKICYATPINPTPPIIDGILNDNIWQKGEWESGFIQHEPYNGEKPTQVTEFKIFYDNDFLYAALRMHDLEPEKIVSRVTRRDEIEGDWIAIAVDSYFDKRTAFVFGASASGVKNDLVMTEDGDKENNNWDPIWWVKTAKNENGWTAEMKIPLNQLRFANTGDLRWGLQVTRYIYRNQETSMWKHVPKDASGVVHMFGELQGLKGLTPKRQLEIAPYVVTKTERFRSEVENPYLTGKSNGLNAGVDAKIGLSNNFTLDLTVNPDFGQVEADPSEVNLTAFETYFDEKRPFFIEGSNMLSFGLMFGDGDLASQNLFYSRRIGRAPQIDPDIDDDEYIKIPSNTAILGATKITGRTNNGMSVGFLETVTANSYARIDSIGKRNAQIVEPLTNYTVGSLRQELNNGNTIVSGMLTSTNRQLNEDTEDYLHKNAYTGGLDLQHMWANKKYIWGTKFYFSHVNGTKEALISTQKSSSRYFQRPDKNYAKIDSSRTSLTGTGGMFQIGKIGEGHIRYIGMVSWKSPQLEINDIGYTQNVDDIFQVIWVGLRYWEPRFIFRSYNINFNQWTGWNFGGQSTYKGGNVNFNVQFKNYWSFNAGINRTGNRLSATALWGGPMVKLPGNWNSWYNVETDERKSFIVGFGGYTQIGDLNSGNYQNLYASFSFRPSKNILLRLNPSITLNTNKLQVVDNIDLDDGTTRYLRGSINQKTYVLSLRVEYNINPELSIQYYGRPYFTSGKYTDFKYIKNPKANRYTDRFNAYLPSQIIYSTTNEEYSVDENSDGISEYSFSNPNFNYMDFQSNFIVRWEYRPGSTVFFVWTLGKQTDESTYSKSISGDINNIYSTHPHNIFLVKLSYRFN